MSDDRFDRNELFFGKQGQRQLRATRCVILGVGGLGTHVAQQLALLGVGAIDLVEPEELEKNNRNRYIGVWRTDQIPGARKTETTKRLIGLIDDAIDVDTIDEDLVSPRGVAAIRRADVVFGCVDNDGSRLILTEICSAYSRTYIDLASDIDPKGTPMTYGGRVHFGMNGDSCLVCMEVLDVKEAGRDLESVGYRQNRDAVYGIEKGALEGAGPSVVSINGVVASLAVTEFMAHVTGIRSPCRLLTFRGETGKVMASKDAPRDGCYYCKGIWGKGKKANVERYIE